MPEQVWKFELQPGQHTIEMPAESRPLLVAVQRDTPCVWVRVDPSQPKVRHGFEVVGTGHDFEGGWYVGSFLLADGALVFHVLDHGGEPSHSDSYLGAGGTP